VRGGAQRHPPQPAVTGGVTAGAVVWAAALLVVLGAPAVRSAAAASVSPAATSAGDWRVGGWASLGFDTYSQRYYPTEQDTTEVLSELAATLGAELSHRPARGWQWRLRPEVTAGTERTQERLAADQTWRAADGAVLWRSELQAEAIQYGSGSDYYLTSDSRRLRGRARWLPGARGRIGGELRVEGEWLDYDEPSSLELDRREWLAGAALASGRAAADRWRLGMRLGRRTYPDSSAISRDVGILEASYDHDDLEGVSWRLSWRSERRQVDRPEVRPSSWSHWLDAAVTWPLGDAGLELALEGEGEWWRYDTEQGVYTDLSRSRLVSLLRGGGLSGPAWSAGLAGELLDSDSEGESYRQLGLRVGADWFGDAFSGTLTLEAGKRHYLDTAAVAPAASVTDLLDAPLYTDFTYVELWLTATWRLHRRLELDALASYLPENHDREIDDQTLGLGSLRLVYRF